MQDDGQSPINGDAKLRGENHFLKTMICGNCRGEIEAYFAYRSRRSILHIAQFNGKRPIVGGVGIFIHLPGMDADGIYHLDTFASGAMSMDIYIRTIHLPKIYKKRDIASRFTVV